MKYLLNLCGHDGIASHYNGVGSMVERYAEVLNSFDVGDNELTLNLITPEYHADSFAFSSSQYERSSAIARAHNGGVYMVSNGTSAAANYGDIPQWQELCENTALLIKQLSANQSYDYVINLYNDTPFAGLANYIKEEGMINVWIPHSTVKIHGVDSAMEDGAGTAYYNRRLLWEEEAIDGINRRSLCYVGMVGLFIEHHLVNEYGLSKEKVLRVHNGIFTNQRQQPAEPTEALSNCLDRIHPDKPIILSYARAEEYKNLEYTMRLGAQLHQEFQTVVIAQSYFPTQPILDHYRELAASTGTTLFIDPPFTLPKAILQLQRPTVVLVPSHKEIMGLIVNEIRAHNNPDLLIVANDVPGLNEQINDGEDGVLIDVSLQKIHDAAVKICHYFTPEMRERLRSNGITRIANDYNIVYNFNQFLHTILSLSRMKEVSKSPYERSPVSRTEKAQPRV